MYFSLLYIIPGARSLVRGQNSLSLTVASLRLELIQKIYNLMICLGVGMIKSANTSPFRSQSRSYFAICWANQCNMPIFQFRRKTYNKWTHGVVSLSLSLSNVWYTRFISSKGRSVNILIYLRFLGHFGSSQALGEGCISSARYRRFLEVTSEARRWRVEGGRWIIWGSKGGFRAGRWGFSSAAFSAAALQAHSLWA